MIKNHVYLWMNIKFGFVIIFVDVEMNGLMIIRVKLEAKTKKYKYSRHTNIVKN